MDWKILEDVTNSLMLPLLATFLFTFGVALATTVTSETPVVNSSFPVLNNDTSVSNSTVTKPVQTTTTRQDLSYLERCPDNLPCKDLGASCIDCKLNHYCVYNTSEQNQIAECTVKPNIHCTPNTTESRSFNRTYYCSYCYQLDKSLYTCADATTTTSCTMKKAPPETYYGQCKVKEEVLCLGNRTFYKKFPCNWTSGYKWSTALVLSITLGGFGVDRFYLGLWREGIGKLFSFGGLGVWTIVDVILIAVGYVGPHDSSLLIYPWD